MTSLETLPRITPAPEGPRCLWSVMIPTYNPKPGYLEETLRSVLQQDPGREVMQIEIVDDGSPNGAPVELVRQTAGDRVTVHSEPRNRGLAGIWNLCIQRARGEWIHILHQDDLALPGLYEKLSAGCLPKPPPGLAYCRHAFVDGDGRQMGLSELDAPQPGWLARPLEHFARRQRVQTPAVVVRRAAYEALGGFRSDLKFTLDWEMWCRIAAKFPVWYEPAVLASYRLHPSAETSRLRLEADDIQDVRKCISIVSGYLPEKKLAARVRREALNYYAIQALQNGWEMLCARRFGPGIRQIRRAFGRLSPGVLKRAFVLAAKTFQLAAMKTASRLKHAFSL